MEQRNWVTVTLRICEHTYKKRTCQGRSDGGVYRYVYPQNQSTLQIFMWLLVVFFSLTQDKLLLILKLEGLVKIYTPPPKKKNFLATP